MRLYLQQRRRADEPVTMRDVTDAYVHNFRRTVILAVLWVVLAVCFFTYTAQQHIAQENALRAQCEQRTVNVERANEFYQRLAVVERHDLHASSRIRDELVGLILGNRYTIPRC